MRNRTKFLVIFSFISLLVFLAYSYLVVSSLYKESNAGLLGVMLGDNAEYAPYDSGAFIMPYPYRDWIAQQILDRRTISDDLEDRLLHASPYLVLAMAATPAFGVDATLDYQRVELYHQGKLKPKLDRVFDYLDSRGLGVDSLVVDCTSLQLVMVVGAKGDLTGVKYLLGRGASLRTELDAVEPKTHKLGCDRSVPDLAREYLPEALPYLLATEGENQSVP